MCFFIYISMSIQNSSDTWDKWLTMLLSDYPLHSSDLPWLILISRHINNLHWRVSAFLFFLFCFFLMTFASDIDFSYSGITKLPWNILHNCFIITRDRAIALRRSISNTRDSTTSKRNIRAHSGTTFISINSTQQISLLVMLYSATADCRLVRKEIHWSR